MPPATREIPDALRELLAGSVDYAGLFPPAELSMAAAVKNYDSYRAGPHSWMLGRFVVPATRLGEFDTVAPPLLPRGEGSAPWRLSALVGESARPEVEAALKFNCSHWAGSEIGHAVIDVLELKVERAEQITDLRRDLPKSFAVYFEVSLGADPEPFVAAANASQAALKARTGGVTSAAFPDTDQLARFLHACVSAGVPFKVTAGLHHAVRGEYALTYKRDSARCPMFGFINVFGAAALLSGGASRGDIVPVLEEPDLHAFRCDDDGLTWREMHAGLETIRQARRLVAAFGSCSFEEPVAELATLATVAG